MTTAPPPGVPVDAPSAPRALRIALRRIVLKAALGGAGAVVAYAVVYWLGTRGLYDLSYARGVFPALWTGFLLSVGLVSVIIPLGFAVGFLVGWARTSRSAIARGFGSIYVDFFRSMPPIVLVVFASIIGLYLLRTSDLDFYLRHTLVLWAGVLALALHTAAYQAEIVRAGILSVPSGQTEAADAIGMSRARTLVSVVFPQALRVSLPALGNEFSSVIKDSSLLSVIGWLELSGLGLVQVYSGILVYPLAPIIIWLEVAVFYFVITFAFNTAIRGIENLSKVPGLEVVSV